MMNIQSVGCQPLKPMYGNNKVQSFGNRNYDYDYDYENHYEGDIETIKQDRAEFAQMAKNKDSKLLSSIGTLGVGMAAGALSFFTFKTMAPKGWQMLKSVYNGVANNSVIKKSVGFVKEKSAKFGKFISEKVSKLYNGINPESKLGKVKKFITDKLAWIAKKMEPVTNKLKSWGTSVKEWTIKNQDKIKEGAKNTGATLVAIPAAVTAVNSDIVNDGDEE